MFWNVSREGDFSEQEKELVRTGALKVLEDDGNCESIATGYRSDSKKGSYYVTCTSRSDGNFYNVGFSPSDISAGRQLGAPEAISEDRGRELCYDAIRTQATRPSTARIHSIAGYATAKHNNGNRTIEQEFSAKNAFGEEERLVARCLIQPNGSMDINISERTY